MVVHITDQNFGQEVEQYQGIVLIDFYAAWCGPCKMQTPIVEALAEKYQEQIKVAKLDVDEAGITAGKFGISSIPTLLFIQNGKEVERFIGLRQPAELEAKISQLQKAK
ncbi:MAG: thioredoxin [Candidatus Abawacabacteria bacterium]|nr:thioredoxin [Candidatus Abawacabacteria bacterium]